MRLMIANNSKFSNETKLDSFNCEAPVKFENKLYLSNQIFCVNYLCEFCTAQSSAFKYLESRKCLSAPVASKIRTISR